MKFSHVAVIIALALCGCASDEPASRPGTAAEDNVYFEFNKWVYAQMNQQYLWRHDLPDSLHCDYSLPPKDFFQSLLSPADRFSYFTTNSSYNPSGRNASLGFAWQPVADAKGNTAMKILYTQSPELKAAGFHRGDVVRVSDRTPSSFSIRRMCVVNGLLAEESAPRMVNTLSPFETSTVLLDTVYTIADKTIGYLCYLKYDDRNELAKPLARMRDARITDLILDLRYNPGGYVSTCRFLCNCIVSENAYENIFQQCSYNDRLSARYLKETGDTRTYSFFETPSETLGETLGAVLIPLRLSRLYVITSAHTASASEATIVCLAPYMPVTVIGETTVGKGVGSWTISDPRFRYAIQPITMRYYNADGYSTPDNGIPPDIYVPDGYSTGKLEIGDMAEPLLKAALECVAGRTLMQRGIPLIDVASSALTPVGEPSFVTEFNNSHYNESN